MGRLAKALDPPSAYSVKKTDFWADLVDRIDGCILASQLDEIEDWLDHKVMAIPGGWDGHIAEIIEKKREEIEAEDIGRIIRDRYDFT